MSDQASENCIFCSIVSKKEASSIKYEDDNFIAFDDIYPASDTHVLVIPKKHIKNIGTLTKNDLPMIENMRQIAENFIQENQLDSNNIRLGFHKPLFNSINHLHLHIITPVSKMSYFRKIQFMSFWFMDASFSNLRTFQDYKLQCFCCQLIKKSCPLD